MWAVKNSHAGRHSTGARRRGGQARRERQAGWPCWAACPSAVYLSGRLYAIGWYMSPLKHGNVATCLMLRCARPGEKVTDTRAGGREAG